MFCATQHPKQNDIICKQMSDNCQKCQRWTIMPMSSLIAPGIFPSNEDVWKDDGANQWIMNAHLHFFDSCWSQEKNTKTPTVCKKTDITAKCCKNK